LLIGVAPAVLVKKLAPQQTTGVVRDTPQPAFVGLLLFTTCRVGRPGRAGVGERLPW
jgi:hypothetical protein